jgi:phosphatidylglycerophosphatase A
MSEVGCERCGRHKLTGWFITWGQAYKLIEHTLQQIMDQNQEKSLFFLLQRNAYSRASTLFGTGLYSGFIPIAPGTCGSIVFLCLWLLCNRFLPHDIGFQTFLAIDLTIIALWSSEVVLRNLELAGLGESDPQIIVIDEWAGLSVALLGLVDAPLFIIFVAFIIFRILDATKLAPVRWGELLPRSYGVVADDLIAGLMTLGVMQLFI